MKKCSRCKSSIDTSYVQYNTVSKKTILCDDCCGSFILSLFRDKPEIIDLFVAYATPSKT